MDDGYGKYVVKLIKASKKYLKTKWADDSVGFFLMPPPLTSLQNVNKVYFDPAMPISMISHDAGHTNQSTKFR